MPGNADRIIAFNESGCHEVFRVEFTIIIYEVIVIQFTMDIWWIGKKVVGAWVPYGSIGYMPGPFNGCQYSIIEFISYDEFGGKSVCT